MSEFDLKKRRKELYLTLEQVGDYIGVGKSTVRKWETGMIENMKTDKILLLSEILKVHPLTILGIDENIYSNYFKLYYNDTHFYVPKKFEPIKNFLFIEKCSETCFNIPKNSYLVIEKKSEITENALIALKYEKSNEIVVRKFNKMNENLIIISSDDKDEIIDLFMGESITILGEIIYYIIDENTLK